MTVYTEKTIEGAKTLIGILAKIQQEQNRYENISLEYDKAKSQYIIREG